MRERRKLWWAVALTAVAVAAWPATGAACQQPSARDVIARSQEAFYRQGDDMVARIRMTLVDKNDRTRERELTMLRKDYEHDRQRYYLYFHRPPDVRGTAFLVWAYPDRNDDRWVFVPAVDLVRRLAAEDARSSFVGSDFNYEDVSGRDVDADEHRLVRSDTTRGRAAYVIESRPLRGAEYQRKVSWIDRATYLPLREEYYDAQGALHRVFAADEIRDVGDGTAAIPTVVRRTMRNVKTGHRTEVAFLAVRYDVGIEDGVFVEAGLRRPPQRWIR